MEDTPEITELQNLKNNLDAELKRISNEIDLSIAAIRFELQNMEKSSVEIKKVLELKG